MDVLFQNGLKKKGKSIKYRVFRKNWFFSQFTATPPSLTSLYETFKALNVAISSINLSTQCECTVYDSIQPIAADCWRGRGGKLSENS